MNRNVDYDSIAGSYDRRYLINDYSGVEQAVRELAAGTDRRVLEVGCGTGHWLRVLEQSGVPAAGLDASSEMLTRAQRQAPGTPLVRGVAEQLPWTTAAFDRVFCVNVLHHLKDPRTFLAEARRALRPGGRMMTIGLDPHTGLDRWYIYEYFDSALENDRHRYPPAADIRDWMRHAGFVDCATREVQHLPVRLVARDAVDQRRLEKSATSQLLVLTDAQYERGLDRIRTAIESAEARGETLYLTADLRLYATFGSVAAAG